MAALQEHVDRLFCGAVPAAFGPNVRFVVPSSQWPPCRAPSGFEGHWSILAPVEGIGGQPWATEEALARTTALVVLASALSNDGEICLREIAAYLRQHADAAPPVLLVPIMRRGAAVEDARPWLEKLLRASIIDDVIWGAASGFAFALVVQAKLKSVAANIERLHEELTARADTMQARERLSASMEHTRWQYLRTRMFHALPPVRYDIEVSGGVDGYTLGHKMSRGAFGVMHAAAPQHADQTDAFDPLGILVVDKCHMTSSLSRMAGINGLIDIMSRMEETPHPNVARLVNAYSAPKRLYICFEVAGLCTLFSRLLLRDAPADGKRSWRIEPAGIHSLVSQVCAAVCHLHLTAGVVHRDIRPENLSIREHATGHMDVTLHGFELSSLKTTCDTACGTWPFAAPEVVLSGKQGYDGMHADMWSLGVVLLQVVCGLRAVERLLPQPYQKGQQCNDAPMSVKAAEAMLDILCRTCVVPRMLGSAVPEAEALADWLREAVPAMLAADPPQRLLASELLPSVAS